MLILGPSESLAALPCNLCTHSQVFPPPCSLSLVSVYLRVQFLTQILSSDIAFDTMMQKIQAVP